MAMSQTDLAQAYKCGLKFGSLQSNNVVINEVHADIGSAIKANPLGSTNIATINPDGSFQALALTSANHAYDFGYYAIPKT